MQYSSVDAELCRELFIRHALVDGEVVEIIHCQPRMAAILLSNPEIIQIPEGAVVRPGWKYNEGLFEESKQVDISDDISNLPTFKDFISNLLERK